MNTFQVILLPLLALMAARDLHGVFTGRGNPVARLVRILCWTVAAGLIAFPETSSVLATMMGIGRGADLVMYLFMLAAPIAWFHLQTQNHALERKLVKLARAEAMRSPLHDPQQ